MADHAFVYSGEKYLLKLATPDITTNKGEINITHTLVTTEYPRYKIQFAKHMKLKKSEDQSVDTLPLLRLGNKTPMEGVTETKFGAERKGWTI